MTWFIHAWTCLLTLNQWMTVTHNLQVSQQVTRVTTWLIMKGQIDRNCVLTSLIFKSDSTNLWKVYFIIHISSNYTVLFWNQPPRLNETSFTSAIGNDRLWTEPCRQFSFRKTARWQHLTVAFQSEPLVNLSEVSRPHSFILNDRWQHLTAQQQVGSSRYSTRNLPTI